MITTWQQQAATAGALAQKIRDDDARMASEHFRLTEFKCKCGCSKVYVVPQLLEIVEAVRKAVKLPLTISSGYRCVAHNDAMPGTAEQSKHCLGCAADIGIPSNLLNAAVMLEAAEIAVTAVHGGWHYYAAQRFIHVDCWPWPKDRRW